MDREPTNSRQLMWLVAGGLAAWGLFLAIGSYLGLDPETPDRDFRRFLVVAGCVGAFLAVWLGAVWLKGKR